MKSKRGQIGRAGAAPRPLLTTCFCSQDVACSVEGPVAAFASCGNMAQDVGFWCQRGRNLVLRNTRRSRCEWSFYFPNVAATLAVGRGGSCADSRPRGFPMNQGPTARGMPRSSCPSSQNTAGAAFSSSTLTGFAMSSSKLKSPFHFVSSKMQPPTFRRRVAPASGGVLFSRGPCRRQQVTG